uniref:Solute carrier family 12 member 10, tandem duplicate 1 n=1 Tax=Nothobranchius furzeri TaxID=105023 RepID=A0A8C6P6C4_NOTFU
MGKSLLYAFSWVGHKRCSCMIFAAGVTCAGIDFSREINLFGFSSPFCLKCYRFPQLQNYATSMPRQVTKRRPSLGTLRKTFEASFLCFCGDTKTKLTITDRSPPRFGWIEGVMIRCMLNIWGVILFLRLTWITSQAGIVLTCLIILMSVVVTVVTALSISAIATNGSVASGGTYFLVSRTMGPEIGGPIGVVFSFANALASVLNIVGFAEVISQLLQEFNVVMVDPTNDVRIVGVITVTAILLIILAGMTWVMKTQMVFFLALMIAFSSYIVGTIISPSIEKQSIGIFGYRGDIFVQNLTPDWRGDQGNFFQMFALFFPSVTCITAGANISGDLKDPASAIPKGTLLAILWTTLTYLVIAITSGACVVRDASGNITDFMTGNITDGCVGLACNMGWNFTSCSQSRTCNYGLECSIQVISQLSGVYYLITVGVFAASLSSALGFFVSAPKMFQCLCSDKIYPYIIFFAKGYGKNDEPFRSYALCYIISVGFILIAQLDVIALLISNFFLCVYGLINFSCFHASMINSPGWRPAFRFYSKWTSLFGAVVCLVLMFLFTWWSALITVIIIIFLYGYVVYTKPKVNWGSSIQAESYNMALSYSVSLTSVEDHVKNFRPQCLVMTGPPKRRPALVDFVSSFTKHLSSFSGVVLNVFYITGYEKHIHLKHSSSIYFIVELRPFQEDSINQLRDATHVNWLNKRKVRSFYTPFTASSLREGTKQLLQATGLGKLKPNTLVLGFKSNWKESTLESIDDYINTIFDTFDSKFCLCVLRMIDGLDVAEELQSVYQGCECKHTAHRGCPLLVFVADDVSDEDDSDPIRTVFQNSQGKKTIDVYWIADDGGLTLLIPYLFTRRRRWRKCKVRVFIMGQEETVKESRYYFISYNGSSANSPFISFCFSLICSLNRFEESVIPFRLFDDQQDGASIQELRKNAPWKISDKEFEAFKQKASVNYKCSRMTALVLVSLPVPQRDCPSALYMAWLDTLTYGLHCPVALIRGNQQNVLTLYCQ